MVTIARWFAKLSNEQIWTQDDDNELSCWTTLKNHVESNNLQVCGFWLANELRIANPLPVDAQGYFFSKKVTKLMGDEDEWHSYLIGVVKNGLILVQEWKVPELILVNKETRHLISTSKNCIILNEAPNKTTDS